MDKRPTWQHCLAAIGGLLLILVLNGCDSSSDGPGSAEAGRSDAMTVERDVAIPMRDSTVLRADIYRPPGDGPFPVLLYRTPYGKHYAVESYPTHRKAVERGYAVVLQDVRGRYASDGIFVPYRNEGRDGFDTIEWAATQSWSNGDVGTFGLSYPGAVQWLAALEGPPSLKAMAPAMTFSSPRNFFYMNGVFDLSWLPWIYLNIAPDARQRRQLPGPSTYEAASAVWESIGDEILSHVPLAELPYLRDVAPYYFEWLDHPPEDPWWDWAEVRGRYNDVSVAVLNLSGWYDEAYGPEGAITNHNGLASSRRGTPPPRSHLIMGPWKHGVIETGERQVGDIDFGPRAGIDYDEVILRFFEEYLRDGRTGLASESPVRYFIMGSNEWRESNAWPPEDAVTTSLCLGGAGVLGSCETEGIQTSTTFDADPANPVMDPYDTFGPHDYSALEARDDLLTFDSELMPSDLTIAGNVVASIFISCDCRDLDMWVRLQDVYPDGRAINLRSPGAEVLRTSYRDPSAGRQPLEPGRIYEIRLENLIVANTFRAGHRIRAQISASFAPHLSRNLQTGESEVFSGESKVSRITVHHDTDHRSSLHLPVLQGPD